MHTLVLLRHAKSDYPPGVGDHARPLADRGRRDAPEAGRWLVEHVGHIDRVVVSDAARTRQTWQAISDSVSFGEIIWEPRVYEAHWTQLHQAVAQTPESVSTLMIVGHNPGLEDLAAALVGSGDKQLRHRMAAKFPTSAIAVLTSPEPWAQFADAELTSFTIPRG